METMHFTLKKLMAGIALIAFIISVAGCASVKTTSKIQNALGGEVATSVAGAGSPTLVLQSGLGDGKESWGSVFEKLSITNRVFAYDRPGYGDSSKADGPRDPCTVAAELRATLKAAGLAPPYILVGHSIGGLYHYTYAKLYPEEVVGLVLLDPTHPTHWERMQKDVPAAAAVIKSLRLTLFNAASRVEFDNQARNLERIDLKIPLDVPVRMLTRTTFTGLEAGSFETMVHSLESDWVRLLGRRCVKSAVPHSGHYIHKEHPEVVVAEVRSLNAEVTGHHQK